MNYLVFDVGGTAIKYALMNEAMEFIQRGKIATPLDCIESFVNVVGSVYDKYKNEIDGIAMSLPGILDAKNGLAITGGYLEYNQGKNIVEILEKRCPTKIVIENDGKCAAIAEASCGVLSEYKNCAVIVLGSGVGGGLIINGDIYRGRNFFAGEFSFINTNIICNDIKVENLWGQVNSYKYLTERWAAIKNLPCEEVSGEVFLKAANEGEEDALKVLDEYCYRLAGQIFNLQCVIDPEAIAIGGGISSQEILIKYIEKNIKKYVEQITFPVPMPKVMRCKYRNDANLIGALNNFLKN